jgi:iron(III) transport system ATP-binding protein
MSTSALTVAGVSKHFGSTVAVDDVSFELGEHEVLALVGPSGCGKSTLLRVLGGIHPADSGRVELAGAIVDDGRRSLPPEQRRIGLVFQDHALFPHLTVAGNVGFGIRDPKARPARTAEMLQLVGLTGYAKRYPHELSGGERQRIALARALALQPALLLLDEPFASLDPNLRARIRDEVVDILRSTRTPALFVTHDQQEALAIGDRIAVMDSGRIVQLDHPAMVFHRPTNRFVASFMGDADFLEPRDVRAFAAMDDADLDCVELDDHLLMVRPDDIHFTIADASTPAEHVAEIVHAEFRGSTWCYTLRLSSGTTVRALRTHLEPVDVGTAITPSIKTEHRPVVVPS